MRCIGKFKRAFANDHLLVAYLLATPVKLGPNAGPQPHRGAVQGSACHTRTALPGVGCRPLLGGWQSMGVLGPPSDPPPPPQGAPLGHRTRPRPVGLG